MSQKKKKLKNIQLSLTTGVLLFVLGGRALESSFSNKGLDSSIALLQLPSLIRSQGKTSGFTKA